MTLKFVDLHSGEVMWAASATRTGWGYSNLSSTASKTIDELLTRVKFNSNSRGRPAIAAATGTPAQPITGTAVQNKPVMSQPALVQPGSVQPGGNRPTAPIRPATIYPTN